MSESTVCLDLDSLDGRVNKLGLTILRKPGHGVSVEGAETAIRNAICAVVLDARRCGAQYRYPSEEVTEGVGRLMEARLAPQPA